MNLAAAIQDLHDRCAIYTSMSASARLLDLVGWTESADLSQKTLLEPCVGEGAILLEGVRRLLASLRRYGKGLAGRTLAPRIRGFEIHPGAAAVARRNVRLLLMNEGVAWATAGAIANKWVAERDFLLAPAGEATHVVANPPYVRWQKLPALLADRYREVLPSVATRGDLAVAFLCRMQEWASDEASIAALVSDRWMFAQYGAAFVDASRARGWHIEVIEERPDAPFVRTVGAYSSIVRFARAASAIKITNSRSFARRHHRELINRYGSLGAAGCIVRVGPALGAAKLFLLEENDTTEVEAELIRSFVGKSDFGEDTVEFPTKRVIVPYDDDGKLIDLAQWPGFAAWAERNEASLRRRSQFVDCERYWRTIDAVPAIWSQAPKLLLPELSNRPHAVLDRTGGLPAHSIYAIWSTEWPIDVLQRVLNGGLLMLTAVAEAPRLSHGWMRFYKRFILHTPLPRWDALDQQTRRGLRQTAAAFDQSFESLFGFKPGEPPIA